MLELQVVDGDGQQVVLRFEHSLRTLSKWEEKHQKPLLTNVRKTDDEWFDYYRIMLQGKKVDRDLLYRLSPADLERLGTYVSESRTATKAPPVDERQKKKASQDVLTSEFIYMMLSLLEIDWECQDWHLSRTIRLIEITSAKKTPDDDKTKKKRRPTAEVMSEWAVDNERQKKLLGIT